MIDVIDPETLPEMQQSIKECTAAQERLLNELRSEAKLIAGSVRTIYPRSTTAISLVASDGGNNKLVFDPFYIQLVRVVDSYGKQLFLNAVSPSTDTDTLSAAQFEADGITPRTALGRLMHDLNVAKLSELSPMIPTGDLARKSPEKVRISWVQDYRDLCEWAVLYDRICYASFATNTLIVRDGLLRSKIFHGDLFIEMMDKIQDALKRIKRNDRRDVYIVGLAKHSKVLDRYRLAIALENVFPEGEAKYARIPRELERKAYIWQEWAKGVEESEGEGERPKFNAGDMYFVRFGPRGGDPIWPVDVFSPQSSKDSEIFGYLLADARDGFPIPFYPRCLQKADEYAQVADLDLQILQDNVINAIKKLIGTAQMSNFDKFLFTADMTGRRYR